MRSASCSEVLAVVLVAAGLAGCGGGRRATAPVSSAAQVSSTSCAESNTGSSGCVYVVSDGRRFHCAGAPSASAPSVDVLARICTRMTPIAIPPAWRRVFATLDRVRACLTGHGLRVTGGPALGMPRTGPDTPIGELVVINGEAPGLIGFYVTDRGAELVGRENEHSKHVTAMTRRGAVLVLWTGPASAQLRTATAACAFG
jgi:hypothetical protein